MSTLMFPEAPSPTVPITFVENSVIDSLLIEFPNHLIIPTVMEHFCGPIGGNNAEPGYLAKPMAERLSVHRNLSNELDFEAADRIENLVAWIRKWKKIANAARRKRQAGGQSVDLVPFEGQCLDLGIEIEGGEDAPGEIDEGGAPTALGLRLKQRADDALAEYQRMMWDRASQATNEGFGGRSVEKK
jgi:hypothetical protein